MTPRPLHTALVIEPSPFRFQGVRQALRAAGIERVLQAEAGTDAVTVVGEELVDVVLMPWQTADLSGHELIAALQARSARGEVALLLLDNELPQGTVVQAVKAGVLGRVAVPPDAGRLRALLETIAEEGGPGPTR